jgi:MscS family membrane protein
MKPFDVEVLGNPLWKYIALFGFLLAAGVLHFVVQRLLHRALKLRALPEGIERSVRALFGRPLGALLYLFALWAGIRLFALPAAAAGVVRGLFITALTVVGIYIITKLVDLLFSLWRERARRTETKLDDQVIPILSRVTKFFIWAIGILLVLQNLGYNVTSLLAGLGIGGLAVALAAQETLSNFIGALAILVDRPCEVGDRVDFDQLGIKGTIEAIGLRSTRVRTLDGTLVSIPNRTMANTVINNVAKRPTIKNEFVIGIVYDTPYEKIVEALKILREILANHPSTANYRAYFKEYGPYSLNIVVTHWCKYTDWEEFLKATEEINLEIKRRFEEAGIEFAFPTQTIQLVGSPPAGAAGS